MIAETLSGARRHDAQHIIAGQHMLDHIALRRPEIVKAEHALEMFTKIDHDASVYGEASPFCEVPDLLSARIGGVDDFADAFLVETLEAVVALQIFQMRTDRSFQAKFLRLR